MKTIRTGLLLAALAVPGLAGAQSRMEAPRIDTGQDISGLGLSELRILRNTVFAVHGYDFKDTGMQRYFWNQPWYQKIRREMERAGKKFSPSMLTAAERKFTDRIKAREEALLEESRRGKRPGQLYVHDLIANANQFPRFGEHDKRMIEDHGFVVMPARHEQFFFVYEDNDYRMIPSFVTSDSVLQLYHVFFDFSLRDVEKNKLLPAAVSLCGQLLSRAQATVKRSEDPAVREAAELLAVYLAVAQSLFGGKDPRLSGAPDKVLRAELALVREHAGRKESPLLKHKMDYSQFIPRGHYTRSEELKRFFLGMTWLGQAVFRLESDRHLQAALLLAYYLHFYPTEDRRFPAGPLRALWETIYEPTAFFVGKIDDLSPVHVRRATEEIYGAGVFKVRSFADAKRLAAVRKRLAELDPQRIKTAFEDMPNSGIRFMGQRHVPDSEILQRLVKFPERPFPKGLDLFAVFGSPEARELLDEHFKEPRCWAGYLPARDKLAGEFKALPESFWSQNLYWSWLDSLRVLIRPSDSRAPPFAHTRAWRLKQLQTALGSWSELRHDTILYAKPFGAECGGGDEPPKTPGYVEPVPDFFSRLRELLAQTKNGLEKRKLLTSGFGNVARQMDDLLAFLERVARKQLAGEKLSAGEHEQIRLYGAEIQGMTTQLLSDFGANQWHELQGPDRNVAVIADIGTTGDRALEVGVGPVSEIFVVVELDGEPTLTRGAVFSYYEFTWPAADRLTDEKWHQLLGEDRAPPRPDWVKAFESDRLCPKMPDVYFYSSGC